MNRAINMATMIIVHDRHAECRIDLFVTEVSCEF